MGLNDVPNELLIRILTLIRKPTPTVLSRPDRAELKQHDLTSAIRVSKVSQVTALSTSTRAKTFSSFVTSALLFCTQSSPPTISPHSSSA